MVRAHTNHIPKQETRASSAELLGENQPLGGLDHAIGGIAGGVIATWFPSARSGLARVETIAPRSTHLAAKRFV